MLDRLNEEQNLKIAKKPVKHFIEYEVQEQLTIWYNLYNFIDFWYTKSLIDGLLSHDNMARFVDDFIESGDYADIVEKVPDENFEKILKKFHKKIKKSGGLGQMEY